MKAKLVLMAGVLAAAGALLGADRVELGNLPPAVQKSLAGIAAGDAVSKITMRTVGGRTVYDIELERRNAPNPRVRIAEDGQVLRDIPAAATADEFPATLADGVAVPAPERSLKLDELPPAAQATIRREAAGREIAMLRAERLDERDGFAVQFRESGRNPWLHVANDGTVLRPTEKPPALLVGTTFADTPAAVQQAIRREARGAEIVKIDKEPPRGAPTYRVELKDANGTFKIQVSNTGDILENTRAATRPHNRG